VRHDDHFQTLLTGTVNLNQDRLDQLDARVTSIYDELAADDVLGPYVQDKIPQGSWAQRTIIKPVGNLEFDADFLLLLDENPEWSEHPKSYIAQVNAALGRSGTYKGMPRKCKCRCVRVTYANSCHIDIVPYLRLAGGRQVIVNGEEDKWEPTNPKGFTEWMREKDRAADDNLRKVIRLLKYLRDHMGTFQGTRSVILTTLTGERVDSANKVAEPGYYNSVPTALLHIVQDLDQWLQENWARPSVVDPSGSGVSFDHRWDDATYETFRDQIHDIAADIHDAYYEPDEDTSVGRWQDIFGDGFRAPPPQQTSGRFGPVAPVPSRPGRAG
jgi:hypothetical protein